MTEWEVVGVIVVLVGLVVTITKPIVNLNGSIVKLTTVIDVMDKRNQADHRRIDSTLADLEARIRVLEGKK